jgi:hypothetical protein
VASKPAGQPVVKLPDKTARMLRRDLAAARAAWLAEAPTAAERETRERSSFLAYRDEAGRFADFHSLRAAYITRLIRGGVNVKQAQVLARHSTAELTVGLYADADAAELGAAVARLRPLPGGADSALCAESAPETAPMLPAPPASGPNRPQQNLDKIGAGNRRYNPKLCVA